MASDALLRMLRVDPMFQSHPTTKWLLENPTEIERVLPTLIKSAGEYARLQRMYPGAARELGKLAYEMGKAHRDRGNYNGQL